jgi:L-ascorbate metabolism protein UlaG (beta-lactamase superfamily)
MRIRFLGHATFLLTTAEGVRIISDPYEPGGFGGAIGYGPILDPADLVTVSHQHGDHNSVASVPGKPMVIDQPGGHTVRGVVFRGLPTYHDANRGGQRGANTVWYVEAEGLRVCHLGDLGTTEVATALKAVGPIDVLLVPVGGTYTIDHHGATELVDALAPRIAIPMHYLTPRTTLNLAPVDEFLEGKPRVRKLLGSDLEVTANTLPTPTEIVVLEPAL